ncbi:3-oxoacyl-[acyl-carrier protein] reductase [Rhizobium sp. ERR 922]|uniref:SDR family NAD(P)-dependent oxidoreductase n=1 Tax=unclassified Rhizobium TaxID=2613769 RepID=UPI0011A283E8|nr:MULTISPECIES: SDR family NAD(P)-dependent oxidoreductase [unclassified Rhizobium]TWB58159.1 3-oxoacyl-[acyl-carrier protein] reductase [Rhizobium sp. ERR 922]TWB99854.1 3-oxoacyl-[acyl-carrier protein] reductase [Rhizobium sp. ERR 942]
MDSLEKRIVIVTGAGIGIGQATAKAFAALGDHVVVTDILEKEGEETVRDILTSGGSAEFHLYDVRSTEAANRLVANVEARFGKIDVIVANAGIAHRTPLDKLTDDKWDLTMDVDLKGIFKLVRAAVPGMRARGSGSIVALSSIMGVAYGWDEHVHYSAAKSGVVGLVRGLAVELAKDGIRVNGIAPGYIRTAQLLSEENSLGPAGAEKAAEFIPMGRLGEPEDIADVIAFLASKGARYMTGQVLVVDGGLLVGRY